MSGRPKRTASGDLKSRSPVRQRTNTSEDSSSPNVPDRPPAPRVNVTLGQPDGQRTTYDIFVDMPAPGTIPPDIIISMPESRSPTPGDVPEAEEESQEEEEETTASPPSTGTSDMPKVKMESPKDEEILPKGQDDLPKDEDETPKAEDKSPEEIKKESSPEMMDES
ncbi:hypothetical protein NW752_001371 [Fusarium irregulare]|uniref:Uncharacterized protein n=1 Tax=Fusarium irregulare TaxID=2494466 RepID=A0A9W8PGK9_9HYPO|nr:hypothetical protein NW766_010950 [Fusarium irregulare]KAJ4026428.1 hypothetical protein NW752_001371 [Fusarium irregulare]